MFEQVSIGSSIHQTKKIGLKFAGYKYFLKAHYFQTKYLEFVGSQQVVFNWQVLWMVQFKIWVKCLIVCQKLMLMILDSFLTCLFDHSKSSRQKGFLVLLAVRQVC